MRNVILFRGVEQRNPQVCGDLLGFLSWLWMWLENVNCAFKLEMVEPLGI